MGMSGLSFKDSIQLEMSQVALEAKQTENNGSFYLTCAPSLEIDTSVNLHNRSLEETISPVYRQVPSMLQMKHPHSDNRNDDSLSQTKQSVFGFRNKPNKFN